jgi:hypothetical protein
LAGVKTTYHEFQSRETVWEVPKEKKEKFDVCYPRGKTPRDQRHRAASDLPARELHGSGFQTLEVKKYKENMSMFIVAP